MSLDSESNQRFSCTVWHLRLASLRDRPLAIARVIPHTRPTKLPRLKPLPDQSSGMGPTERLTTGGFDDPVRIGPNEPSIQGYMFEGYGFMVATVTSIVDHLAAAFILTDQDPNRSLQVISFACLTREDRDRDRSGRFLSRFKIRRLNSVS